MNASCLARALLWRTVLTLSGGLRVRDVARLPAGPCVIIANHSSHADTAALIAALPADRCPAVAAAADYWFRNGLRSRICRALCGAFPVRRAGGGSADLAAAACLLAAGRDVIVYPEGTRSKDGTIGEFHRGAARLAAAAGVPLVPAGISGTRTLLPPGGSVLMSRRATVTVSFGVPLVHVRAGAVPDEMAEARVRVSELARSVSQPAGSAIGRAQPGRENGAHGTSRNDR